MTKYRTVTGAQSYALFTADHAGERWYVDFIAHPPAVSAEHHFVNECGWSPAEVSMLEGVFFDAEVRIGAYHRDRTASAYLGACQYATVSEFFTRYASDYFADMVSEATEELPNRAIVNSVLTALGHYIEAQREQQ